MGISSPAVRGSGLRLATLRDERGIALVMALGIMLVLAIASGGALMYAASNSKSASASSARQKSFALAEAGVNNALSVLYDAGDPTDPNAVGTGSQTAEGGTYSYSGSLSGSTWTLTGTGTIPNPAAGGTITRTVSTSVTMSLSGSAWQFLFSDSTSCLSIKNNAVISAPIYARGDLCLSNNAHLTGSPVDLLGSLTIGNNASVGYAGSPIDAAHIKQGCKQSGNPHACTVADAVYANTLDSAPPDITKPPVDLDKWYNKAAPGPKRPCTSGSVPGGFDVDSVRNGNRPAFDLASGSAYDCRYVDNQGNLIGQLTWIPSSGTLVVKGTIYFDGDVHIHDAVYQGRATIYASGTVDLGNNVEFCGVAACDATWNSNNNLVVIVAGSSTANPGFEISNNAVYQGAAYVVTNYVLKNNASNWGPVIASDIDIKNNSNSFLPITTLTPGAPGIDGTLQRVPGTWGG